ncbi:Major Facilitator Superfamily protein [Nocardioides scoriae]|uniref:Major Facilitator Superfamily protein n=1 Tax=Nocardioides scoriae TaxID=642780 RepID=A0A1H1XK72_9ACTN|nr:MFS transporter [Nocardioides scoriae]SDT09481.1 Major Facilitator Superfamily protein [Nocardioides scoriae]
MSAEEATTRLRSERARVLLLAGSLLSIELLAGMQRYLSQTVLPLMAADLDGRDLYGPLDAAAQAPMFLMMPIGAWLLSRFRVGRLMLAFTLLTVLGAVLCALAPSVEVFVAGTAVRALAAGALATIGLGAISRGLPARHRQLVLAGMSGVWVVSSVLGPVYAVAVSSALDWRWAMVLYLPLLVLARTLVARSVPERSEGVPHEPAPWGWSLALAGGSAALSLPVGAWSGAALVLGAAVVLWATRALLPGGVIGAREGRRAALGALGVTASVYFGASMVLSVVAHDALGLSAGRFGVVIAAPGFCWALTGLWCGAHPAADQAALRRRVVPAGAVVTAGVVVLLATTTTTTARDPGPALAGLLVGGALLGLGMGSLYPDLLGRLLTRPEAGDGISEDRMAAAVVLAETVGMALATTTAFTWLGTGLGLVEDPLARARVLYAALLPLAALMLLRLAAATRSPTDGDPAIGADR